MPGGTKMEQENRANEMTSQSPEVKPQITEDINMQKESEAASSPEQASHDTSGKDVQEPRVNPEVYEAVYKEILENLHAFTPSDQVACRITEEHITSYLENNHEERVLQYKERREKRFFSTLELIAVLASIVLIVWALQDNSAILVTLLYIIAGLGALFIWKSPDKLGFSSKTKSKKEVDDE